MPKNVKCKNCNNLKNHWCERVVDSPYEDMERDCAYFWQRTNADRIRSMTDEELADFICLSPEMEFEVCEYCEYGNRTRYDDRGQCLHELGVCYANARAKALGIWLQQPAEVE